MTAANLASPSCPQCGGEMWDETKSKFYKPGKPTWKCKDKACGGVLMVVQQPRVGAAAPVSTIRPAPAPATSLDALLQAYTVCFHHAANLAKSEEVDADVAAMAATIFIQACKAGL